MISLANLKLRIGLDEDADDELLEQLEAEAVAHFEQATNRYFGAVAPLVDVLSGGAGGRRRFLSLRAPVATLTSVESLGGCGFVAGADWTQPWTTSAFDYASSPGRLYLTGLYYPRGLGNLRVTYVGGYAAGSEPADVRGAIAAIVADTYRQGRATATPVDTGSQQSSAGVVVSTASAAVIANWRRNPGL